MSMLIRWSLERLLQKIPTLFDELKLPEGADSKVFIDTLLDEYGSMGIAYPVTRMQKAIGTWSARKAYALQGFWDSTQQQYNMIENYDRHEEWTDKGKNTSSNTQTTNSKTSMTGKDGGMTTTAGAAFDSTTFKPYENVEIDNSNQTNGTGETIGTGTGSMNTEDSHTAHIHGNIGVTTAAQMIREDRELHDYDFYMEACQLFARDLLVEIYFF